MRGDLFINGKDAWNVWGAFLEDGSLSALMTPPPVKGYISNASPLTHGKNVVTDARALPKVDERDIQLTLYIRAESRDEFFARYADFVSELQGGIINIRTKYQPNVTYRCLYISCQQFSQYDGRLAKFALRLNEPDPMNRENDD